MLIAAATLVGSVAAAWLIAAPGTTVSAGAPGTENGRPCPPDEPDQASEDAPFDGHLEQLVQDEAEALGGRFAGASLEPDGTVTFRITGGKVSDRLRNHPKVRIVKTSVSADDLDAAMGDVADRLNPLLAPGVEPGTPGRWPWSGHVDIDENAVLVQVDPAHEHKDAAIRTALADHLRKGTVRYCYAPVPESFPL